jgi:hypothetical protein
MDIKCSSHRSIRPELYTSTSDASLGEGLRCMTPRSPSGCWRGLHAQARLSLQASRAFRRPAGGHAGVAHQRGLGPSRRGLTHGFAQGGDDLRAQHHPPRATWHDLHPIELATLAPIGNRIHRHIELLGCGLSTLTPVATLTRRTGRRTQWATTLHARGRAQPIDRTGRKCAALPPAVAFGVETLGNGDIGLVWGQLPYPLEHLRRRATDHRGRRGPRDFQRTPGLGVPAHLDANGLLSLAQGDVLHQ